MTKAELKILSGYFADISKILVGSLVLGFFAPINEGPITLPVFLGGTITAMSCLFFSLKLAKRNATLEL